MQKNFVRFLKFTLIIGALNQIIACSENNKEFSQPPEQSRYMENDAQVGDEVMYREFGDTGNDSTFIDTQPNYTPPVETVGTTYPNNPDTYDEGYPQNDPNHQVYVDPQPQDPPYVPPAPVAQPTTYSDTYDEGYSDPIPEYDDDPNKAQDQVEVLYPHTYLNPPHDNYPYRGSWRAKHVEIMDIIDRDIYIPEQNDRVPLLHYFDMVLLTNVCPKNDNPNSSCQTMQVYTRTGPSNDFGTWKRIHVWPISSGLPQNNQIETFTGVFKFNPDRVFKQYNSYQKNGRNMFETMFLYHNYKDDRMTGVAVHGTEKLDLLGQRDSGGCIRIAQSNSQCLYETMRGKRQTRCLDGGELNYWGTVPSFVPQRGEADPSYDDNDYKGETGGYRILVGVMNDTDNNL